MADDGGRRELWIIAAATILVVVGGLTYFGWSHLTAGRKLDTLRQADPDMTEAAIEARARALDPPRPAATQPAVPFQSLRPIVFADGKTTARITNIERFAPNDPSAPHIMNIGRPGPSPADSTETMVRLTIEFDDAQPEADQDHLVKLDGAIEGQFVRSFKTQGHSQRRLAILRAVEAEVDRLQIEVAAAVGPFTESQRITVGEKEARLFPGEERPPLRITELRRRPEAVLVLCDDDPNDGRPASAHSWVLQAVLRDGRCILSAGMRFGSATGRQITIPAEMKDIEYVTYRHRPYDWQSFGEVALPPVPTTRTATPCEPGAASESVGINASTRRATP